MANSKDIRGFFRFSTIEQCTMKEELVPVDGAEEDADELGKFHVVVSGIGGYDEEALAELREQARKRLVYHQVGEMTQEELDLFERGETRRALLEVISWGKEAERRLVAMDQAEAEAEERLTRVDDNAAAEPPSDTPEATPAVAVPAAPTAVPAGAPGKERENEGEEVEEPAQAGVAVGD